MSSFSWQVGFYLHPATARERKNVASLLWQTETSTTSSLRHLFQHRNLQLPRFNTRINRKKIKLNKAYRWSLWESEAFLWNKNQPLVKRSQLWTHTVWAATPVFPLRCNIGLKSARLDERCWCYLTGGSAGLTLCLYEALLSPAVHMLTRYLHFTYTGRNVKRLVFSSLKVELHMSHDAGTQPSSHPLIEALSLAAQVLKVWATRSCCHRQRNNQSR